MSQAGQNHQPLGEMFSARNTNMPTPLVERRGFTPSNIQQPAPTPTPPQNPEHGKRFQGSFTPSNIIMPSVNPKPISKPEGKK